MSLPVIERLRNWNLLFSIYDFTCKIDGKMTAHNVDFFFKKGEIK